ncbi:MAG: preprotein translocase subunit SecG [Desulfuromonas sp.]|nr:MAG: preprotein translocase subunit SecG [Desulfuromonas sp.]
MTYFLLIIHITVCLALIGIVLIQGGKGAEIGAAFGAGSSNTVFGASGGQSFLGKMTTGAAIIFMLTSLALAIFWGQPGSSSIMPEQVAPMSAPSSPMPASMPPTATEPAAAPTAPADKPTSETASEPAANETK